MNLEVIMELYVYRREANFAPSVELVERKGRGHPDTLADRLAEHLSARYSLYTRQRFGVILYHNFDKVGLLGGESEVAFGAGQLVKPIRVLLNGRAADRLGNTRIPLRDLLQEWASEFLTRELPLLNVNRDLEFHYNISTANTPGYPVTDFKPESVSQLHQLRQRLSSDTAAICVQVPLTPVEEAVIAVERLLTDDSYRNARPWLGSDIKVLACRTDRHIGVTVCVPQIAQAVRSIDEYRCNLETVRQDIYDVLVRHLYGCSVELHINTKDNFDRGELYLTAIGSCIESGDEGLVGRGNRPNGVISANRPHTGEAACGKHPVFFPGKVYPVAGWEIATRLYAICGTPVEIWLIAQEGRPLYDPWKVIVIHESADLPRSIVEQTVSEVLGNLDAVTEMILDGRVSLCP
jgi:S-adenosylmethionine synthetase